MKIILLLLFIFSCQVSVAANKCEGVFKASLEERLAMTQKNHLLPANYLLQEMAKEGSLIYQGDHSYRPGTEFLASNEFDWHKTPKDHQETDLLIGFGTNTSWDLAARKKAKQLVIADWSPWPIIAQRYIVEPLIRISKSPTELILLISGVHPNSVRQQLSLNDAFDLVRDFDSRPVSAQKNVVEATLKEIARDERITDDELKFLTTYFRPRVGDNLFREGLGPFQFLRNPTFALLNHFYSRRYDTRQVGFVDSVFSSITHFKHLKSLFDSKQTFYAMTSITDSKFYQSIVTNSKLSHVKSVTLSITNIFDCGGYNGLTFLDLQNYLKNVSGIFHYLKKPVVVFRTTSHSPPHGFYRYEINSDKDIPRQDEMDSTAIKEAI